MEQALYPTKKTLGRMATGLSFSPLSHLEHNEHIPNLLSSTPDLGSFEALQDADLPFEGLDTIEEVECCEEPPSLSESFSFESTQQFIEEMDTFIKQHEENLPLSYSVPNSDTKTTLQSSDSVDDESKEALQMLDALIHGEMPLQWSGQSEYLSSTLAASLDDLISESTSGPVSTPSIDSLLESPSITPCSTLSPTWSTVTDFSPPPSVDPLPNKSTPGKCRKYSRIGGQKLSIKDKKERKKWQNVEAARRYRDKKRAQVHEHLLIAKDLEDKNKDLKSKLREVENELLTMKKLMTELGMIKVVRK